MTGWLQTRSPGVQVDGQDVGSLTAVHSAVEAAPASVALPFVSRVCTAAPARRPQQVPLLSSLGMLRSSEGPETPCLLPQMNCANDQPCYLIETN